MTWNVLKGTLIPITNKRTIILFWFNQVGEIVISKRRVKKTLIYRIDLRLQSLYSHCVFWFTPQDQLRVLKTKSSSEIEQLSKKIIQSPERVKADEQKSKENLEILKMRLDQKRQSLMEKQKQFESIDDAADNVEKAIKMLKDIEVNIEREKWVKNLREINNFGKRLSTWM